MRGADGLTDKLFDPELPLEDIVLPTTHPNISFVAAGDHVDLVEHIAAERATALFDDFAHSHDLVLLSGGRVPQNSLALALAPLVGCVLIIATEEVTKVEELDLAEEALRIRKAREIGLVVAPSSRGFM